MALEKNWMLQTLASVGSKINKNSNLTFKTKTASLAKNYKNKTPISQTNFQILAETTLTCRRMSAYIFKTHQVWENMPSLRTRTVSLGLIWKIPIATWIKSPMIHPADFLQFLMAMGGSKSLSTVAKPSLLKLEKKYKSSLLIYTKFWNRYF